MSDTLSEILDPTIPRPEQRIDYVPRPGDLSGLRIGLIDSTKKNSGTVLRKIAAELESRYGMKLKVVVQKHQRAPLLEEQIAALKGETDFAIVGVGD
jgi:hypothetical protein